LLQLGEPERKSALLIGRTRANSVAGFNGHISINRSTLHAMRIALAFVIVAACRGEAGTSDTAATAAPPVAVSQSGPGLVIDSGGIGPLRIGQTLDEARRALSGVEFSRTSDGDGVALVGVPLGGDTAVVYADESDASAALDWTKRIESIEVFGPVYRTAEGVRVGMPVADVEKIFGKVREILLSEIESRQYVTFEKQPRWLIFRLDYTGVFEGDSRKTTKYEPSAKIFSIEVR
jgi:hypothetical protein